MTRTIEIRKGQLPSRNKGPTLLPPGGCFQVTAPSENDNDPKGVDVKVTTEAVCQGGEHPEIQWADAQGSGIKNGKSQKLDFYRQPMPGDDVRCGFFAMLNAVFSQNPVQYPLAVYTCGMPNQAGGGSVERLDAVIEVFPADQFSLDLTIPPLFEPHWGEFKKTSASWETKRDRDDDAIEKAGDAADEWYQANEDVMSEITTRGKWRESAEDQTKKELGYVEGVPDGVEIELTQTDGRRTLEAPIDDVVKLIKFIRDAEYRFRQIQEWIDTLQVGPGVYFKIGCQFLVVTLSAKWGYTEYADDRVFFAYGGAAKIDLIKVELDLKLGFKCMGMADLLFVLNGEGTIGVLVPEFTKETPDDPPHAKVKPEGELKISGGVEGSALWVVKVEGTVEVVFKADTEDFSILTDKGILAGKIILSREPTVAKLTVNCWLWGSSSDTVELIKEDKELAVFEF